jgi:hypothetical protein
MEMAAHSCGRKVREAGERGCTMTTMTNGLTASLRVGDGRKRVALKAIEMGLVDYRNARFYPGPVEPNSPWARPDNDESFTAAMNERNI